MYGVRVYCSNCTRASFSSLHDIALDLPQVRCFWQTYPRIRMLPEQQIRIDGRAVLLARIENVVGTERFDVLFAQNTFAVIGVHGCSDG